MWLLVAIVLVVGALFVLSVRAWISILAQETDRRACPTCKARMVVTSTPETESGLSCQCTRCGRVLPFERPRREMLNRPG
ncbi:hypothetical protein JQ557_24930 [Bradyrhizobium sp. U87765 SZCCT0131]|uniref:hypothetical protein n=1 Tax=unclassified Bradyrhizobium TaxID=2631580 RepID=UPI001BAE556E|nr:MULTISPECIES: hypothetical protein [unclassified Bradyrhizobium]MBR1221268.1 hypothetical protein [Bradyrhizobium sp. U87765 SZCCT0131]MBR1259911.1 hypothetical protein [Bradyrhizobium sp. U87765 SZCCT0134]MBR1307840.1 hypothetical protein [Bradyrhizobium sp. U87765 SZCCT0110]MBR1321794.1 hypothetical protein [Bradyrhizobium sp. U87765 SZCCT0109]MBR1350106.1 hypothetical protein [Bradyrhizobium sp. U87765 SZCCT0048]